MIIRKKMLSKALALGLAFLLLFSQTGLARAAAELNLAGGFAQMPRHEPLDKFRAAHLRFFSYDTLADTFSLLMEKGDSAFGADAAARLSGTAQTLLQYFLIGVALPNELFWVNLRPDGQDNIIDHRLAQTDIGRIFLEADLELKKDTARLTSPESPQGRRYWDKLYRKAEELFGSENVTIPTLTRPWIVPGEIILRQAQDSAYVYKANLKVMLEQDHLHGSAAYNFSDPRMSALNEYSSQLIRELILPELTREVNLAKRYANLRQVFYSLILARWFKSRFSGKSAGYARMIDKADLTGLTSNPAWVKTDYFKEYQKSFKNGEYNLSQPHYGLSGKSIRTYFSGGIELIKDSASRGGFTAAGLAVDILGVLPRIRPTEVAAYSGIAKTPAPELVALNLQSASPAEGGASSPAQEGMGQLDRRLTTEEAVTEILRLIKDAQRFVSHIIVGSPEEAAYTAISLGAQVDLNRIINEQLIPAVEKMKSVDFKEIMEDSGPGVFRLHVWLEEVDNPEAARQLAVPFVGPFSIIKVSPTLSLGGRSSSPADGDRDNNPVLKEGTKFSLHGVAYKVVGIDGGGIVGARVVSDQTSDGKRYREFDYSYVQSLIENGQEGSSPVKTDEAGDTVGGIDFRAMEMVVQPMGSFRGLNFNLPKLSSKDNINLDKEFAQIKNMLKSGMLPSGQRMKEFLAGCFQKDELSARQDNILVCLVDICRLQEELAQESSPEFKEALVIFDTRRFAIQ